MFVTRYLNDGGEPDSSDRTVVFTVYDGTFYSSSSLNLIIDTVDDNPTTLSVNGSGRYDYIEGNAPIELAGILLEDDDAGNSDVIVNSMTFEVINGAYNEMIDIFINNASNITVSISFFNF